MGLLTVNIGDCKVSRNPEDTIVTHALGSCIAIVFYDPVVKVGGLLHYMLPDSALDADKATARPYLFADSGIPLLLQQVTQLGASKSRAIVMAVGGAQMLDPNGTFNIGQRNHLAMRKACWKAGIIVQKEDVGGSSSRTVRIDVATGKVLLSTSGGPDREMIVNSKKIGAGDGLQHTHRR